jgi:hypothetical protein
MSNSPPVIRRFTNIGTIYGMNMTTGHTGHAHFGASRAGPSKSLDPNNATATGS